MPDGGIYEDSDDFGTDDTTDDERQKKIGVVGWVLIGGCAVLVLVAGAWLILEFNNRKRRQ